MCLALLQFVYLRKKKIIEDFEQNNHMDTQNPPKTILIKRGTLHVNQQFKIL